MGLWGGVIWGQGIVSYLSLDYSNYCYLYLSWLCHSWFGYVTCCFAITCCFTVSLAALVKPSHLWVLSLQEKTGLQGWQVDSSSASPLQALKDFPDVAYIRYQFKSYKSLLMNLWHIPQCPSILTATPWSQQSLLSTQDTSRTHFSKPFPSPLLPPLSPC